MDITRRSIVLSTHESRTKLPNRRQKINVICTHECLCHGYDCTCQRCFTMVICSMLRNIANKLCNTNLSCQAALQATEENLALTGLEAVDEVRKRADIISITEVDKFIVDESRESNLTTLSNRKKTLRIISCQPLLAIICALLAKCERQAFIGCIIPLVLDFVELAEPFLCFLRRARTQSLVVLESPSSRCNRCTPSLIFTLAEEATNLSTPRSLKKRSCERADEARAEKRGPLRVKEIHEKTLDMRTIQILICHDHHATIAQRLQILIDLRLLKAKNLLNGGQLFILTKLIGTDIANIEHLTLERKDAPLFAPDDLESSNCTRCSRISLGENERTFITLCSASPESIDELRHTTESSTLLSIGLLCITCSLCIEN